MSRVAPCFWCGTPMARGNQSTLDHLVPRWFRTVIRTSGGRVNLGVMGPWMGKVNSCLACNWNKGPMPPAEFARCRTSLLVAAEHRRQWHLAAERWRTHWPSPRLANYELLLKNLVRQMLEPFEHNGARYPYELQALHARRQQHWRQRTQMTTGAGK